MTEQWIFGPDGTPTPAPTNIQPGPIYVQETQTLGGWYQWQFRHSSNSNNFAGTKTYNNRNDARRACLLIVGADRETTLIRWQYPLQPPQIVKGRKVANP